jgi:hypothetical protein
MVATLIGLDHWRWYSWWRDQQPGRPLVSSAIEAYTTAVNTPLGKLAVTDATRHFPAYLSHHYGSLMTNATFWAQPEVTNHVHEESRRLLAQVIRSHQAPSPEAVRAAEVAVGPAVRMMTRLNALMPFWVAAGTIVMGTCLLALSELLGAVIFGQSLLLRLVHIGIVNRRHEPAERWRLLLRWLLVWPLGVGLSAVIAGMIALGIVGGVPETFGVAGANFAVPWPLTLAVAVAALSALFLNLLVNPSRSLGDLIARTRLVPR